MENTIRIISEAVICIFNLLIYIQLTVCKKDSFITKLIMYIFGGLSVGAFLTVTSLKILPESTASTFLVVIPSFVLFFVLSKYKDFRFFVTFCFLDTVTYIVAFCIRTVNIIFGDIAGIISTVLLTVLLILLYIKGKKYFKNYRELLSSVKEGWGAIAFSATFIYILLIFISAYPKPMVERPEYIPVVMLVFITVISFYVVFLMSIYQKKKLYDLNDRLSNEKRLYKIAYSDALTGMKNRTSYIKKISEFNKIGENLKDVYAVMIDIDNFKNINDTFGHYTGDIALKTTAQRIETIFSNEKYLTFRIGGDEFAVISVNTDLEELVQKLEKLKLPYSCGDISIFLSVGYSKVDFERKRPMENAFAVADIEMYENKTKKK